MSSDLVRRLRAVMCSPIHEEAARAIEALEAEVAEANRIVKTYYAENERLEAALDAAEARTERLRVALERLGSCEAFVASGDISPEVEARIDFARKALEDDKQ